MQTYETLSCDSCGLLVNDVDDAPWAWRCARCQSLFHSYCNRRNWLHGTCITCTRMLAEAMGRWTELLYGAACDICGFGGYPSHPLNRCTYCGSGAHMECGSHVFIYSNGQELICSHCYQGGSA